MNLKREIQSLNARLDKIEEAIAILLEATRPKKKKTTKKVEEKPKTDKEK